MARTKSSTDYTKIKSFKNEADFKKAVAAANARIKRIQAAGDYTKLSKTFESFEKFKFDVTRNHYKNKYSSSMFTKSGKLSSSTKGMTKRQIKEYHKYVLSLLTAKDFTVPDVKTIAKNKAKELGTSLSEYMKRVDFWKIFRETKEATQYGSDEVFNAVEISANDHSLTYEEKLNVAKALLDALDVNYSDEQADVPVITKGSNTFTYEELNSLLSEDVTDNRIEKYTKRTKKLRE